MVHLRGSKADSSIPSYRTYIPFQQGMDTMDKLLCQDDSCERLEDDHKSLVFDMEMCKVVVECHTEEVPVESFDHNCRKCPRR